MKKLLPAITVFVLLSSCGMWNKNSDNIIYISGKTFHYTVSYLDSGGNLYKTQPLNLSVTDGFYPERKQTQIIWTLYEGPDVYTDKTGVIDGEYFFIHQPRIRDMHILSFAEFPTISKDVFNDSTITRKSEGTVTMAKTYKGTTITSVKTTQNYTGKTSLTLPGIGPRRVHFLEATATSEIGAISGKYYFDEEYGFVKMNFVLPDNRQILIEMTENPG